MNWYSLYFHTNKRNNGYPEGKNIQDTLAQNRTTMSEKQKKFYSSLVEFLKEKGWETKQFERPRDLMDYQSKVNGMKTILYKNELAQEFFERYYGKEG